MSTVSGDGGIRVEGLEELQKSLGLVNREVFAPAAARGINRAVDRVATLTIRSVSKTMGAKSSAVRDRVTRRKVSPQGLDQGGKISIRGNALGLMAFGARQTTPGVSAAPWGNRKVFRSSFIVEIRGERQVMIRAGKQGNRSARLPIRRMLGPGPAKTAESEEVTRERNEFLDGFLVPEIMKQMEVLLARRFK